MKAYAFAAACLVVLCGFTSLAQGQPAGAAVQTVVTAEPRHEGRAPTALTQSDVAVSSGKDRLDVLEVKPATGDHGTLQLFLLLDDSSSTTLGSQFGELKSFINSLPAATAVAIGYMRDGGVDKVQDFTTDHAAASGKIRLPLGSPGASASPYFSLSELIKHWPVSDARREVLMVTDGVDRYYGGGPDNPYVETAYHQAQRAGISVSSVYWQSVGHFGHSWRFINWGQNYLAQIAEETGGEAYWQGIGNPVSFAPFLRDFAKRLSNQYIVTFRAKPHDKPGLEPVKIRTELRDIDLVGPSAVWVP
jgi:hypothetical protein